MRSYALYPFHTVHDMRSHDVCPCRLVHNMQVFVLYRVCVTCSRQQYAMCVWHEGAMYNYDSHFVAFPRRVGIRRTVWHRLMQDCLWQARVRLTQMWHCATRAHVFPMSIPCCDFHAFVLQTPTLHYGWNFRGCPAPILYCRVHLCPSVRVTFSFGMYQWHYVHNIHPYFLRPWQVNERISGALSPVPQCAWYVIMYHAQVVIYLFI